MDFRQYDPAIGRFTSIDPITHHSLSPYNAFDNNPIFWADPSGANAETFVMDLFKKSSNGTIWTNNNNGSFSSNDGQTEQCDECKELEGKRTELVNELDKLRKNFEHAGEIKNVTQKLTMENAIAGIITEYVIDIKNLTDEMVEYLLKNPDKLEKAVQNNVEEFIEILAKNKTKPSSSSPEEVLNTLSGLGNRAALIANMNIYLNTAIKIAHKGAQANYYNTQRNIKNTEKKLNKIENRLNQLQPSLTKGFNGGFGGGGFGGGTATGDF